MVLKNCDASKFIEGLDNKKVICFGAGTLLIDAEYEILTISNLENHIAFFVDNDSKKQGLKYKYKGNEYDVFSPSVLETVESNAYVILITCTFYVEIYEQLKRIKNLRQIECYMYDCVCSYPDNDLSDFFTNQIKKEAYVNYQERLRKLKLKNKYKGKRCFIIGNGPSLTINDLEKLKDEYTFAANRVFKIFNETDWRPSFYFCVDIMLYGIDHKEIRALDLKYKFIPLGRAIAANVVYEDIYYYNRDAIHAEVDGNRITVSKTFRFSDDVIDRIYGGQTVLYDMIQMAVYMGFEEIYLIGVDNSYKLECKEDGSVVDTEMKENHFCDAYDEGLDNRIALINRPHIMNIVYNTAKIECEKRQVRIANATRGGKLEVMDRISLEQLGL